MTVILPFGFMDLMYDCSDGVAFARHFISSCFIFFPFHVVLFLLQQFRDLYSAR